MSPLYDNKLEELDNKLEELDNKLEELDNKLEELDNKLEELDNKLEELDNKLEELDNKLEEFTLKTRTKNKYKYNRVPSPDGVGRAFGFAWKNQTFSVRVLFAPHRAARTRQKAS